MMRFSRFQLILILFCSSEAAVKIKKIIDDVGKYSLSREEILKSPNYRDKVFNIEMTTSDGEELIEHWINQGFSGLIAAIAMRRLKLVEPYQKRLHVECASEAETLSEHAKCLIELEKFVHFNRLIHRRRILNKKFQSQISKMRFDIKLTPPNAWASPFRRNKRAAAVVATKIRNAERFELKSKMDRTPFGIMTAQLSNTLKLIKTTKKKKGVSKWQQTIARIGEKAEEMRQRKKWETFIGGRVQNFGRAATRMRRFRAMKQQKNNLELSNFIDNDDVHQIILRSEEDNKNQSTMSKMMTSSMNLIRSAAKLGLSLAGFNTTNMARKNIRIASPKFLSVVAQTENEPEDEINILSPSLFALHENGVGVEKSMSMKSLLDSGGIAAGAGDVQKFLDFIVDATGTDEAMLLVEEALKKTSQFETRLERGPEGQPVYFTKKNVTEKYPKEAKKIELFEKLDKLYTKNQLLEMKNKGFSVLTKDQLELVYGQGSVAENTKFLEKTRDLPRSKIDRAIMESVKGIADEKIRFQVRKNDYILSPVIGASLFFTSSAAMTMVLSPVLMTPVVGSPSIFGTTILSPWIMVPVILSPRLMCPRVLTPSLMVPAILSPLVLNPTILCPGIMNPVILSPLLLHPYILSPQVMTPLILSPFALSPSIMSPGALAAVVFSPFVLSPSFMSPKYFAAVMFSPFALSPAFHSKGTAMTILASPNLLS